MKSKLVRLYPLVKAGLFQHILPKNLGMGRFWDVVKVSGRD